MIPGAYKGSGKRVRFSGCLLGQFLDLPLIKPDLSKRLSNLVSINMVFFLLTWMSVSNALFGLLLFILCLVLITTQIPQWQFNS